MNKICFYFLLLTHLLFSNEIELEVNKSRVNLDSRNSNFSYLIGVMVEFVEDNNPETSGNGKFLIEEDLSYINYADIQRCDKNSKLVIDLPPHNSEYFSLQMEAVKNYYESITNNAITFEIDIIENIYQLNQSMAYYATSDSQIGSLFSDSIELASSDIEQYIALNNIDLSDVLFVVFHAGLGQEASQAFDPTIYDIRSAYVDPDMLDNVSQLSWTNINNIERGIVLPETLNWIYYDVIEDIFPVSFIEQDDLSNLYCDIQIGMTGLFAHLLGFHFGFPLMSNVNTGDTRIGKFGLMDTGWSNMNGIIPPRPNPWTRSNTSQNVLGWVDVIENHQDLYQNESLLVDVNAISEEDDQIYKFDISDNEYFLIENRNNRFDVIGQYSNMSIEDIIDDENQFDEDYLEENDEFINLFDVIDFFSSNNNYDIFEINSTYNVITKVKNYDYGLPGSGILIWHIDEPSVEDYLIGVNNDLMNKSISLEEGDGIEHIGNPNYYLFTDFSKGSKGDFWYLSNDFYQYINYQGYENQNYLNNPIIFDNESIPNSNTKNNIDSYVSFEIKDNISNSMTIEVSKNYSQLFETIYIGDNISVIGNNNSGCIYYNESNIIYKMCSDGTINELNQDDLYYGDINSVNINTKILVDLDSNLYLVKNSDYYIDNGVLASNLIFPKGYYNSLEQMEEVEDALSLGDIDLDGYDEKIIIVNNNLQCVNSNESISSGFPVEGDFEGVPLIVDILDDNNKPEIICKNGEVISIVDNEGNIKLNIPSFSVNKELSIVPNWGSNDRAALINGNILIVFDSYNSTSSYWHNPNSNTYNNPIVSGPVNRQGLGSVMGGIDMSRAYNYPNPIIDGLTKFRFFVLNSNEVIIKIYDAAGVLVDRLSKDNLVHNEFNEILWDTSKLNSGLYFAELKSDLNESKLIKMVIIK